MFYKYLLERQRCKEKGRDKEVWIFGLFFVFLFLMLLLFLICWFTPQMVTELGLSKTKAKSKKLCPGLPCGWHGAGTQAVLCCSPRHKGQELDQKQNSHDWTCTPIGAAVVTSRSINCYMIPPAPTSQFKTKSTPIFPLCF